MTDTKETEALVNPMSTIDLAVELERLHEAARGCEFDLVPADGPIARLTLFMHEHGTAIAQALRTPSTPHVDRDLSDPNVVHVNMVGGRIARPSIEQIIHIYGERELRAALSTPHVEGELTDQALIDYLVSFADPNDNSYGADLRRTLRALRAALGATPHVGDDVLREIRELIEQGTDPMDRHAFIDMALARIDALLSTDTVPTPHVPTDGYLIRKHGMFYRPNARGYTHKVKWAGRFTLEDAIAYSHPNGPDGPRDGITYVHESEVPGSTPHVGDDVLRLLKEARDLLAPDAGGEWGQRGSLIARIDALLSPDTVPTLPQCTDLADDACECIDAHTQENS